MATAGSGIRKKHDVTFKELLLTDSYKLLIKNCESFQMENTFVNRKSLAVKAIIRFVLSVLILGCFLFIPAGTFKYLNGWIFLGVIFIPMIFTLIILLIKDPELLEKRFKTKKKEKEQKLRVPIDL